MTEPVTKAGDELLTDVIQDNEAPSYHVIERVRRGILAIEAEARDAERARIFAEVEALPTGRNTVLHWAPASFSGCVPRAAVLRLLGAPDSPSKP